ncbi:Telomerase-binding protein EST1A [Colletotrichum fructicola Nara gc5]|uniref:Telomerase-binding protein EST1A n=2 Tax=Colletotrichum fructicola (strain Nara gc5) TaxID=1213859 RepID=A0A7J6IFZ8_COLFN|nr:Telomerase-binding protein EST1A [Colletotrichum fructicola Nara gc5]KAF4881707.1 Telomerase-binding protein EST1A [Colletotrichum fructicola]
MTLKSHVSMTAISGLPVSGLEGKKDKLDGLNAADESSSQTPPQTGVTKPGPDQTTSLGASKCATKSCKCTEELCKQTRESASKASRGNAKRGNEESPLPPKRSGALAPTQTGNASTSDRKATQKRETLWSPEEEPLSPKGNTESPRSSTSRSFEPRNPEVDQTEVLIKQLETRLISQEQLVAEGKGIYAGLVMVESKCIEVDNAQGSTTESSPKLNNEQWQALIALHRTLLHEHHDFFLASQHPSASPALRRLASKYAMPARLWRHGIHSFLELLRHRLPASLEHMLTFIYLAYSMVALLYETVPTFEDTWIECLGDLGRYRMAIEDDDLKDREVWTSVSRHWYSKASDKAPTTGRLYHHLAILARPNALQQLFYYSKSLCVPIPFLSARESIMTLFEPHLNGSPTRLQEIDAAFVRAHAILFSGRNQEQLAPSVDEFIGSLDNHIGRTTRRWMESGYHIGVALGCSLLEYGSESNVIMRTIKSGARADEPNTAMQGVETAAPSQKFLDALDFACRTHDVVFRRFGDPSVTPYLHVTLSFLHHLVKFPAAMAHIESKIPWKLISLMLNTLIGTCTRFDKIENEAFPRNEKESPRPLPDDFAQRGLLWVEKYYPADWFTAAKIDDEEKYFEVASMMEERQNRCLWLGNRIAATGKWLTYDKNLRQFSVAPRYAIEIANLPTASDTGSDPPMQPDGRGARNGADVEMPDA